jgi:ABC-type phosphate transport system substrate-binding protein
LGGPINDLKLSLNWPKRVKTLLCILALAVGFVAPSFSQSGESLVVVVNIKSTTESLSKKQLIDIYMGRFNKFPNGEVVKPVDLDSPSNHREKFYELLVGQSERKVNAYWSRLLFSGRATPPHKAESLNELISIIENDTSALAYIDATNVQKGMKIVYEF